MPVNNKDAEKKDDGSISIPVTAESNEKTAAAKKKKNANGKIDPDEVSSACKSLTSLFTNKHWIIYLLKSGRRHLQ
jgi:hypothetical protein